MFVRHPYVYHFAIDGLTSYFAQAHALSQRVAYRPPTESTFDKHNTSNQCWFNACRRTPLEERTHCEQHVI